MAHRRHVKWRFISLFTQVKRKTVKCWTPLPARSNIGQHQLGDQVGNCRVGQSLLYIAHHHKKKKVGAKWDGKLTIVSISNTCPGVDQKQGIFFFFFLLYTLTHATLTVLQTWKIHLNTGFLPSLESCEAERRMYVGGAAELILTVAEIHHWHHVDASDCGQQHGPNFPPSLTSPTPCHGFS